MKNTILLLCLIFGSFVLAGAQPRPTPTPIVEDPQRAEGLRRQDNIDSRSDALRNTEAFPVKDNKERKIFQESIRPLYREPTKEERKLIAPGDEDLTKFAEFLKQPKTGLIKLTVDKNCGENDKVVNASDDCQKYTMPGAGASYSFRINDYRIRHLADINYTGRNFRAFGVLTHGIFANIGDVPVENVNLQTEAVRELMNFEPAGDYQQAQDFAVRLDKGIESKGLVYRNILPASENTTYVLRSIAYRANVVRTVGGISYDEMEFDKRKDIVVAFRVIRRDTDGSLTILWKELSDKNAPKLKENKKD